MNYSESNTILEELKKAKRIIVNCHRSPDPDSIGSALAMYKVLRDMGKTVDIVCPSDGLYDRIDDLPNFDKIQKSVDFTKFDFTEYDLFISLDSSSWDMITDGQDVDVPKMEIVVIDHHKSNTKYGTINLVDYNFTSVCELLYIIFKDWEVEIDKQIATSLMAGIIGDTGAFRYPESTARTFKIAAELIDKGADKDKLIFEIYRSDPFNLLKFYGEVLNRMKHDKAGKFVWAAIPYEIYDKFGKPQSAKESAASLFTQITDGTDFGLLAVEKQKGKLSISFRSRTGFDTSKIAVALGGGGHIYASGGKIEGLEFDKAVEKLLKVVKKFTKKNKASKHASD